MKNVSKLICPHLFKCTRISETSAFVCSAQWRKSVAQSMEKQSPGVEDYESGHSRDFGKTQEFCYTIVCVCARNI